MNPETIKIPAVEEGACLLHLTGLPLVPRDTSKALFFSYPFNTTGTEQAGEEDEKVVGSFKAWPVAELFGQPLIMKLPDGSFPEAKTGIKIIQFTGCDESKAKALMKAIAEKVPDSIFDSDNLDRGKGFITGISLRESLRESVRTEPEQKKLLTLFISIPHLGPAAQPLQGVLPHSKTLQEYRFMQTPAFPPTAVPDEIVRVYQTWFLLFDNDTIGIFRSEDDKLADRAPLFPFQDRRGGVQALVHMLSSSITITERTALKDFRQKATDLEWKLWSNIQAERTAIDRAAAATPTEKAEAEASLTTARSQVEFSTLLFERTMVDLSTILRLVRYQIQKLEELLRVIQNGSMPREWNKHPRNSNPFEIDGIAHEKEQTKDAHDTLKWMVEEREKALAQINALNQDLEGVLSRVRISDLYLMR
ncbi:hypothetical protein Q9L58_008928 [Maublancomyces gigas]|uniref:Uncharacterized protein n=1 Tax=Discina gigas TaxID=1032678 RepID=A0ABR3G8B2_9PEZI